MKKALLILMFWRLVFPVVLPAQTIYELDLANPATYEVTCYRVLNPSHWTVTNDSCSLYTPLFPVSSSCVSDSTVQIPVMLRINQSGNLWATDYAIIHYYQDGSWILLDSMIGNEETANQTYLYEIAHHYGDLFGLRVTFVSRHNTHDWQLSDGDIIIYDPCVSLLAPEDEIRTKEVGDGHLVDWWWPVDPGLEWVELLGGADPENLQMMQMTAVRIDSAGGSLYRWQLPASTGIQYIQAMGITYSGDELVSDLVVFEPTMINITVCQTWEADNSRIWINTAVAGEVRWELMTISGSRLLADNMWLDKGMYPLDLPPWLPAGAYILVLRYLQGQVVSPVVL